MSNELFAAQTTQIVSAYVAHNAVTTAELQALITTTYATVAKLGAPAADANRAPVLTPAVPVRKSVTPDGIICLEDGKTFKSLKRHLRSHYNLSPDEYRIKWGLPADYPMVAPSYSTKRSELAKAHGLGKKPGLRVVA